MSAPHGPRAVVDRMMAGDAFSRWLGVEVLEVAARRAVIRMTVRPEMANGFGIAHGGIVYALADSAFAFATNSAGGGAVSVAVDCTMSYPAAVRVGDVLTATGVEQSGSRKLGFCEVTVRNQEDAVVGHFRGTSYRTSRSLFDGEGAPDRAAP